MKERNNNEVPTITKEDCVGEIKDFPVEVVQKMVEEQAKQGNKADVSVFQKDKTDGFIWVWTEKGFLFWKNVIYKKNFDIFFRIYPKSNVFVYYRGDEERSDEIIKELEKLGGKKSGFYGAVPEELYYINSSGVIDFTHEKFDNYDFIKENYTEAFLPEKEL